jgi:exopolyphosphatase/guanosine-5'-triphosphate,3'-diphosphate pyrophosphatase
MVIVSWRADLKSFKMQKVAIIDMGTNTFHLLLAEVGRGTFRILRREKVAVKIGAGGINEGYISEAAAARAVATMIRFKEEIDRAGITLIKAFGTSALRNARNGKAILDEIKKQTTITPALLSGQEEAAYIFKGVQAAIPVEQTSLVMDIGGGSVEFIIGRAGTMLWSRSYEIGGQRLQEKFQKHDPITQEETQALFQYFSENLEELVTMLHTHRPEFLLGSSGTFDTLSDIYCLKNNLPLADTPETPFRIHAFEEIYFDLISKNRQERMQIPGMIEMRVDMIVVACCLIRYVLQCYSFREMRVSSYSLKEGVLAEMTERETPEPQAL